MPRPSDIVEPKRPAGLKTWIIRLSIVFAVIGAACLGVVAYFLVSVDRTPREWAPYIMRRAAGHSPLVSGTVEAVASLLTHVDRASRQSSAVIAGWVGASRGPLSSNGFDPANPHQHVVGSVQSLDAALQEAVPGDVIELLPGHYRIEGHGLGISRPGQEDAPITVKATRLGEVVIESSVTEAIKVYAPYWHFENLVIRGICPPQDDSTCEHAFHIVANAKHTVLKNNLLVDFNAQIKINGENGGFPDAGIIDHNTLTDTRPRFTPNPVTPIDLDAASNWLITGNLITDFIKSGGDGISYGAFAKAAGTGNAFERNVVLCEDRLRGEQGQRVGISLGGGGSGEVIRRDGGRSGLEHDEGRISDNLIAFCSDEGIYINRARNSQIEHNTILDTSGIEVRFAQSSADITANIIDGVIVVRDGASLRTQSNETDSLLGLFVGWHPQRGLFADVGQLDLRWRGDPPRTSAQDQHPDLCGATRGLHPAIGAFEDFSTCLGRASD